MRLSIILLPLICSFFATVAFASSQSWPPSDWMQYLNELHTEYLQKIMNGDDSYRLRYVQPQLMDFNEDPDSDPSRLTARLTGERVPAPPKSSGYRFADRVQRILKENIRTSPLFGSSAYLQEVLIPDVGSDDTSETGPNDDWKTYVYPLQQPLKFVQVAPCLVKTVINKKDTIVVRYQVANLPISIGAAREILNKLHRPDVADKIKIHELGPYVSKNQREVIANNRRYIDVIHQILAFVFPDYVERRGWSEQFVRELYFKAIARRYTTNYDEILEKSTGRLLATLGMDVVNYGAVKYFDKEKRRYELSFGPMTELEDSVVINSFAPSGFDFTKWSGPIPILGIEDKNLLPRPLVEVAHLPPIRLTPLEENQMLRHLPPGMHPDLSYPVIFYEGRIGEPTKFKVVKRDSLRRAAYQDILHSLTDIFPISRTELYHLWGQAFYTYNPEDIGVALYQRLGYPLSPTLPPITVGDELWPMQENMPGRLQHSLPGVFSLYKPSHERTIKRLQCFEIIRHQGLIRQSNF